MTNRVTAAIHSGEGSVTAQERDRTKIPDTYKWDLTPIYQDDNAWRQARAELVAMIPAIAAYRGRLSSSPKVLLECLRLLDRLGKEYARLYCYASMNSDEDTRVASYLGMEQEMGQIGADFGAKSAFVQPEILSMDGAAIEEFLRLEPGLEVYRHNLFDVLRRKEHTGTEGEEKIIADAGIMADSPNSIYGIFSNADFPFPEVVLGDGNVIRVDKSNFSLHKAAPLREDRRKVFAAYFERLHEYRRTFGTQLYAEVKKNIFFQRARNYPSCLHRALDGNNIPPAVYRGLIDNVNANLPTFHRYLALRKRLLGVEELHYYDLYAPLVADLDLRYTYEEARELVISSLSPLGDEYTGVARRCFAERWVDVYPTEGKRSGAYSNGGVFDVHPYILLNFNGKYDDVSTIAHELGHTMHSHYSNTHQPFATADYSIFVAEVASTFNEALLMDNMLKSITDDGVRLTLLGNYLDNLRATVFRQTQFAEYELAIHETAERGEALTGDQLGELYETLTRKYYGHDSALTVVDEYVKAEWSHIPHFYYNFYVYQYATSFTASVALSEQVLGGDREATRRYIELLSAGGSDYPIELLKRAGIDMTSSKPFELTMKKMNRVMDEMEEILRRRSG